MRLPWVASENALFGNPSFNGHKYQVNLSDNVHFVKSQPPNVPKWNYAFRQNEL